VRSFFVNRPIVSAALVFVLSLVLGLLGGLFFARLVAVPCPIDDPTCPSHGPIYVAMGVFFISIPFTILFAIASASLTLYLILTKSKKPETWSRGSSRGTIYDPDS